jgi:hypothetical protein
MLNSQGALIQSALPTDKTMTTDPAAIASDGPQAQFSVMLYPQ